MKLALATKRDFEHFFKKESLPYSAKAWVLKEGRKRYALGGIWYMPNQYMGFVKVRQGLPKKTFWQISVMMVKEWQKLDVPILCSRDDAIPNSKRYLEKLGFVFYTIQNNQEIYKLWLKQQSL